MTFQTLRSEERAINLQSTTMKPSGRQPRSPSKDLVANAAQRAYQLIRQRILDLTLEPGQRISEHDLAAEMGLSRTPVHQAVQRLADEGLIEIFQRVGTFVARIPINGLEEAMLVRTALEVAVIERVADRVTPEVMTHLRTILEKQQKCVVQMDYQGFHQADEEFHSALADIAGFPGIWATIQQAKIQIDRFRHLTLPLAGRMEGVVHEHTEVVNALASGKGALVASAMRAHLGHVLPVVEVTRAFRPEFFVNRTPNDSSFPSAS